MAGGYSALGWDRDSTTPVEPRSPVGDEKRPAEATDSDPESTRVLPEPLTITQHTVNVCEMVEEVLKAIALPEFADRLRTAARWHDVGKAHGAFQTGMRNANRALSGAELWAKSGKTGKLNYGRKHFRHELASALAVLQQHPEWAFDVPYVIAAHHGKVRLSIRSLPGEDSAEGGGMFALGVHDGDDLPPVALGDDVTSHKSVLDLSPMRLGGESSWTARALGLLAQWGPFRLAYLETLLRAADVRASKKEAGRA
jgi:CRISPR-associated endonuclease/helicase Cas3